MRHVANGLHKPLGCLRAYFVKQKRENDGNPKTHRKVHKAQDDGVRKNPLKIKATYKLLKIRQTDPTHVRPDKRRAGLVILKRDQYPVYGDIRKDNNQYDHREHDDVQLDIILRVFF